MYVYHIIYHIQCIYSHFYMKNIYIYCSTYILKWISVLSSSLFSALLCAYKNSISCAPIMDVSLQLLKPSYPRSPMLVGRSGVSLPIDFTYSLIVAIWDMCKQCTFSLEQPHKFCSVVELVCMHMGASLDVGVGLLGLGQLHNMWALVCVVKVHTSDKLVYVHTGGFM